MNFASRYEKKAVERDLQSLLVSGALTDTDLERRIDRLAERFRIYTGYYPYGLWAPGLRVNREMQILTEIYLPINEIRRVFDRLFSLSLKFLPYPEASIVHGSSCWLDLLQRLEYLATGPDPSLLLRSLMVDEELRRRFIFFNFLPASYGNGFARYPGQTRFLKEWLAANRARLSVGVSCLDAACGTGEGTYELMQLLMDHGLPLESIRVSGTTLEPLELFAAEHIFFPHDPKRENLYRRRIKPLLDSGAADAISFYLEKLGGSAVLKSEGFDIILCNGLLGGPFVHDLERLEMIVDSLAGRLVSGGILLAADRFHGGWKRLVSDELIRSMFVRCGLRLLPVGDGVGGFKAE